MIENVVSDETKLAIEEHSTYWAEIARTNNWYTESFYVQAWARRKNSIILDIVSIAGTAVITYSK